MLADLEARVAAVEPLRRKKRGAVFLRVAVVSLVVAFGLAAVVFVPFMALTSAAACCEDFLKVRAWLVVVIFLGSGLLTVAAAVGLGVLAYRAVGSPGSGYQARFGDEVVGPLLTSVFPGAAVDVSKGLARAELEATALFPPGLNYDTAFRVDGRVDGAAWAAGDVKAWKRVAGSAGSSDTTSLLTWLEGFLAWVGVPCPVYTPVLVAGDGYI